MPRVCLVYQFVTCVTVKVKNVSYVDLKLCISVTFFRDQTFFILETC